MRWPARGSGTRRAPGDIERWRILRKSLDVRDKSDMAFVYSLEVALPEREAPLVERLAAQRGAGVTAELYREPPFEMPPPRRRAAGRSPGRSSAPGRRGLFAAYFLAEHGYRPLVLERGRAVRERIADVRAFDAGGPLDPESNYLFGEGGAGTFSDGKLTCRSTGPDVRRVLELFAECKGKPSILYDHRPHLGSNRLPAVVKALRQRIEALGGEFRFTCRVEDLDLADGAVRGLTTSSGLSARRRWSCWPSATAPATPTRCCFAAACRWCTSRFRSACASSSRRSRSTACSTARRGWKRSSARPTTRWSRAGRTNLFTFCMCAGGYVMPSVSEPGYFCTNGMSLSQRDSPFANSGLVVTLEPEHFGSPHVLAGMLLQRHYERRAFEVGPRRVSLSDPVGRRLSRAPADHGSAAVELSARRDRGRSCASWCRRRSSRRLHHGLPHARPPLARASFCARRRWSAPKRAAARRCAFRATSSTLESTGVRGLYPVGEGAGYAGGIVSAALDGLRAAKAIIRRYAPLEPR